MPLHLNNVCNTFCLLFFLSLIDFFFFFESLIYSSVSLRITTRKYKCSALKPLRDAKFMDDLDKDDDPQKTFMLKNKRFN